MSHDDPSASISPSTKQIDCREKLVAYRELESLIQYVMIHQNRLLIDVYTRVSADEWESATFSSDDKLCLHICLGGKTLELQVNDVYGDMNLPPVVREEEEEYEVA